MKVLIDVARFRERLSLVAAVSPTRSPWPILQNVKLRAVTPGDDMPPRVYLHATDNEISLESEVEGCTVESPGEALLPPARVAAILRTTSEESLQIEARSSRLHITGARTAFEMHTDDPALFPERPDATKNNLVLPLGAEDLRRLIRRTVFAIDTSSTRYALGGVSGEWANDTVRFVATDGRRLATASCQLPTPAAQAHPLLVPLKWLRLAAKVAATQHSEERLFLFVTSSAIGLGAGDIYLHSRQMDGLFPAYKDIIPSAKAATCVVDAVKFRVAVQQAAIMTSSLTSGVDIEFAPNTIRLSSAAADAGSSNVEVENISHDGHPVSLTFDPEYILDFLNTTNDGDRVTIEMTNNKAAALFLVENESGSSDQCVIMPMAKG